MSYRLHPEIPLVDGVRRVAAEQFEHALQELHACARGDVPTAIHDIRKRMKKLRALTRLVRKEIGPRLYSRDNIALRNVARRFAAARDCDILLSTLDKLKAGVKDSGEMRTLAALRHRLASERMTVLRPLLSQAKYIAEADDTLRRARARAVQEQLGATRNVSDDRQGRDISIAALAANLRHIHRNVMDWPIEDDGFSVLADGLRCTYARGRKAMYNARRTPDGEHVHEWRKRTKYLWYQTRLLTPAWPRVLRARAKSLKQLSKSLGDEHDYYMLHQQLDNGIGADLKPQNVAALLHIINTRREQLHAQALRFGQLIYAEKPSRFADRMAAYWNTGRKIC